MVCFLAWLQIETLSWKNKKQKKMLQWSAVTTANFLYAYQHPLGFVFGFVVSPPPSLKAQNVAHVLQHLAGRENLKPNTGWLGRGS